jgi:F0F1-type ATP synthase assembly protein I
VERGSPRKGGLAQIGVLSAYSVLFIVGGLVAGIFLDRLLNTGFVFLTVGVLAGFGATMFKIIRTGLKELNE